MMTLSTIVTIPDPNFRKYLLNTLITEGIVPAGTTEMTDDALSQLTQLGYGTEDLKDDEKITTLTGIEYCTNLESVVFPYNKLTTLPNLSALTKLTFLDLTYNQITDLSNFSLLPTSMEVILLYTNKISTLPDKNSFSRLTALKELLLSDNKLSDISSLSGLSSTPIFRLYLSENSITDLTPLSGITTLTELQLYLNPHLKNLDPLSSLIQLKSLYISNTQVNSVKSLKPLTNLQSLWLHQNRITSLEGLEEMTNLTLLTLDHNNIYEISPLKNLTNLQRLDLNYNHIFDLSPLKNAPASLSLEATNQTRQLPNLVISSNRITLPYSVKDRNGNTLPPSSQNWTHFQENPSIVSWDNCYGWGNRTYYFKTTDGNFFGEAHLFYQQFHRRDRHYRL